MRHAEQKLWDHMRRALHPTFYVERVENIVMPGRPDVDVMWCGVIIPVELKARPNAPVRSTTPVLGADGLNGNQLNWWLRWGQGRGKGFILIDVFGHPLFAVPGRYSEQVNYMTLKQLKPFEVTWEQFIDKIRREIREIAQTV